MRKPWNKAFSAGPVKGYEVFLVKRVKELVEGLEKVCHGGSAYTAGKVDLAEWFDFLAFDFMGDLAYVSFRLWRQSARFR